MVEGANNLFRLIFLESIFMYCFILVPTDACHISIEAIFNLMHNFTSKAVELKLIIMTS